MSRYDAGLDRQLVGAAARAPFLTRDDERDLAIRWKTLNDQTAMHRLAEAHIRLVIAVAARFRHYGLSMADLVQEGHIGLLEAASRFDTAREVRFSTYATWWIRASIQDFILKNWSIVRGGTSSGQKALFFNLRKLRAKLAQDGTLTQSEIHRQIADALGVPLNDVATMETRLTAPDFSLNAPMGDEEGGGEFQDSLPDTAAALDDTVAAQLDGDKRKGWVAEALKTLNPRELYIVQQRKMADDERTLDDLGMELGISKERVRQLETRALGKLRAALEGHGDALSL